MFYIEKFKLSKPSGEKEIHYGVMYGTSVVRKFKTDSEARLLKMALNNVLNSSESGLKTIIAAYRNQDLPDLRNAINYTDFSDYE